MHDVRILSPRDVLDTLASIDEPVTTAVLDPWYNKGVGGIIDNYIGWLSEVTNRAAALCQHVFVWGFPEIIYPLAGMAPPEFELTAWLTWYYKNCPSVIRGWRSSQMTCLHFGRKGSKLFPEHFLNEKQLARKAAKKLRYMPGPCNVIEAPLNIGFVGKKEQTGHPAQKPLAAFAPLIEMTTEPGDLVLDPMCGSGTTGVICRMLQRRAILCDSSTEYVALAAKRLAAVEDNPDQRSISSSSLFSSGVADRMIS
jgi:site-specific DNA-methyltransferase (adenine-specific)